MSTSMSASNAEDTKAAEGTILTLPDGSHADWMGTPLDLVLDTATIRRIVYLTILLAARDGEDNTTRFMAAIILRDVRAAQARQRDFLYNRPEPEPEPEPGAVTPVTAEPGPGPVSSPSLEKLIASLELEAEEHRQQEQRQEGGQG